MLGSIEVVFIRYADIIRFAGPLLVCALALINAHANAQAGATPPVVAHQGAAQSGAPSGSKALAAEPLTTDEVCRTLEQAAAQNALPVEFFARVIWQESRFNASAVSRKGAEGIAQFMPRTADWCGLADPFDPIEALRLSAGYLRELRERFGNLGLAAAAYNAGPSRVSVWLASHRPLPRETRNYVAIVTGWTADEWASPSPPQNAETAIPQGLPCTRLANLILAPKEEAQRMVAYVPRWGVQLAAHLSESKAWAIYRERLKRFASLIGDREPIVLYKQIPGMGRAKRYIITIADDNRGPLDKLCEKLIAGGVTCDVLRNTFGQDR
jgi:Transglycosylase SLT domain